MMGGAAADMHELPRLDAFDEEFGREPVAIQRGLRRKGRLRLSALLVLLLGCAVAGALALAWVSPEWLRFEVQSAPSFPQFASRESADDQIGRLRREVETLKRDIVELTEARQRASDTIASLKAEQDTRDPSASSYWYSDVGALNYGIGSPLKTGAAASAAPRTTARSEFRTRRRDAGGGTPLSLEAPPPEASQ